MKKTISSSLTGIENQLYEQNSRLSTIETCLCNMFNSVSTPDSSFNESSTVFPTEPPTHANISLLAEEDASFPTVTHNKHHLSTRNKPPPPPLFPLWCLVCGKRKPEKFKKKKQGTEVSMSVEVWMSCLHQKKWQCQIWMGKEIKESLTGHELIFFNVS